MSAADTAAAIGVAVGRVLDSLDACRAARDARTEAFTFGSEEERREALRIVAAVADDLAGAVAEFNEHETKRAAA